MKRVLVLVGLLVGLITAVLVGFAAGGGSEGGLIVEVTAQAIKFNPDEIRIPAGRQIVLRMKNLDEMEHDLQIQGLEPASISGGGHAGHAAIPGGTIALHTKPKMSGTVTFQADKPGTYEVVCTLPGHKELGMVAKLIVTNG